MLSRLFLIIIIFAYIGNGENVKSMATIEGLLTEESEKGKGCGRKAIPPVVARIFSGDSTSPLTREASVVVLFKG